MSPFMTRIATVALLLTCASSVSAHSTKRADELVLRWNSALLQAVRNVSFPPMMTARAIAIVHTSM